MGAEERLRRAAKVANGTALSPSLEPTHPPRDAGFAMVTYLKKADAQKAIETYNGVPLDGKPLKITLSGGGAGGADSVRVVAGGGERKVVVRGGGGKGAGRGAGRGAGSERGRGRGKGKGGAGGRGRGKKEELTAEWARTLEHARSARSRPTRTRPQGRTTPHQPPACHSPANRLPARPGLHTHSPPSSPPPTAMS